MSAQHSHRALYNRSYAMQQFVYDIDYISVNLSYYGNLQSCGQYYKAIRAAIHQSVAQSLNPNQTVPFFIS